MVSDVFTVVWSLNFLVVQRVRDVNCSGTNTQLLRYYICISVPIYVAVIMFNFLSAIGGFIYDVHNNICVCIWMPEHMYKYMKGI